MVVSADIFTQLGFGSAAHSNWQEVRKAITKAHRKGELLPLPKVGQLWTSKFMGLLTAQLGLSFFHHNSQSIYMESEEVF